MLLLSGFINDKLYDQEPIQPSELIKLFNLPIDLESRKPRLVLKLADRYIKKDKLNGGFKFPAGTFLLTDVSGEYKGNTVSLQYYVTKTFRGAGKDRQEILSPKHILFTGQANAYATTLKDPQDLEVATFLLMHPKCANSPLGGNFDKKYMIDDTAKEAANKVANIKSFMDVYNQILGESPATLRTKLAGINKGMNVEALEDTEVIAALLEMIQQNPTTFLNKWQSHTSTFDGIISRLKLIGAVEQYALAGNIQAWRFSKNISQKFFESDSPLPITQVKPNQQPLEALREWAVSDAANLRSLQLVLDKLDQESKMETIMGPAVPDLARPAKLAEMSVQDMVTYGLENNQLVVMKNEGWEALWMKSGEPEEKICDLTSYTDRIAELTAYFESDAVSRDTLKGKIKGALMQAARKK